VTRIKVVLAFVDQPVEQRPLQDDRVVPGRCTVGYGERSIFYEIGVAARMSAAATPIRRLGRGGSLRHRTGATPGAI
jgi:hypothetical protein